jgi:UDP-N-acetylglucosamine--N-acetylmuramyl-(pentapeptide) pyrophosphoryl-undecaprenol N-acetylglucosamine transferase
MMIAEKRQFIKNQASDLKRSIPQGPPAAGHSSSSMPRALRIIIAGGGTGGHLFPGIAIAQEFMRRNPQSRIAFVSTGNAFERSVLSKTDFTLERITVEAIKGRGVWSQVKSVVKLPKGICEAMGILRKFKPDLTVGLGSYSAGPVVLAAWLLRIRVVLHEQNLLPGITNRMMSRFADRIYVSFENTRTCFRPQKVYLTGNPVREDILIHARNQESQAGRGGELNPFTILIIGGSQGAHSINMAVVEALAHLTQKEQLYFVHQTGAADEKTVQDAYRRRGIAAEVRSFFEQMAPLYQRADLIICRAGATTVAEITAIGKAAIFIPYPFAADNHQAANAGSLSGSGAAEMILEKDLSGKTLSEKIEYYLGSPQARREMARKASAFGNPHAARDIVDDCYKLIAA